MVDDESTDGTADVARHAAAAVGAAERLTISSGTPTPPGWAGKMWAVAQGAAKAAEIDPGARYLLLTDGDINHSARNLAHLVARAETGALDLASLMVRLRCVSWAEQMLIPAFVFFFQMLYPFAWVNDPDHPTAGAAGGCMLVRRAALERIGGIAAIKGALIDDCALAAAIKQGGPIWLGLTNEAQSLRIYGDLGEVWNMVTRSAYTQLHYSPLMLLGTVLGMGVVFVAPPLLFLFGHGAASILRAARLGHHGLLLYPDAAVLRPLAVLGALASGGSLGLSRRDSRFGAPPHAGQGRRVEGPFQAAR